MANFVGAWGWAKVAAAVIIGMCGRLNYFDSGMGFSDNLHMLTMHLDPVGAALLCPAHR